MFYWYRRTQVKAWVRNLIREQLVISWGTTMVLSHSTFPIVLRYYATFKMRKFVSLFYKINTSLQKITTCTGLKTANILSKYMIYIFFNFGRGFCGIFPMLFPKVPASCCKKFWTDFCCIVLLYLWAQKACPRFLKSYFKLEILIFLSFVVSLSRYVQLKSSFSDKKTSAVKSETHFSRETIEN